MSNSFVMNVMRFVLGRLVVFVLLCVLGFRFACYWFYGYVLLL